MDNEAKDLRPRIIWVVQLPCVDAAGNSDPTPRWHASGGTAYDLRLARFFDSEDLAKAKAAELGGWIQKYILR